MLDTIFWSSQVMACLGGVLLLGIGLCDELLPGSRRVGWDETSR